MNDANARNWAMVLHLSVLAGFAFPVAGWVAPIVIWQVKKNEIPEIDAHGKMVLNFLLSMLIYTLVAVPLMFVFVGFLLLFAIGILGVIFPIIGGIKASSGELWNYPLTINLIR